MYSVFVLSPKPSVLGGDPATEEGPAARYATHETGICVYRTDFPAHKIKQKSMDFFRKTNEKIAEYEANKRWTFENKAQAVAKCLYEAHSCGHFISTRYGWIQN